MTQEISYRVTFSFPEDEAGRESLLQTIDLFLRTLERADRALSGALGLELDYRRSLREMGGAYFCYEVVLSLHWPAQILLGDWPDPEKLRLWMEKVRESLPACAGGPGSKAPGAGEYLQRQWDSWAREAGLSEALMYTPLSSDTALGLLEDLQKALDALGGSGAVGLD